MSAHSTGQPYLRWHRSDGPYLRRFRLRLEAMLGSQCAYCGLTRRDGVNLQFHHHLGRDYSVRRLSWSMRLHRYHREIVEGTLRYLACDETGNDCHTRCRRRMPRNAATKLYDYPPPPSAPTSETGPSCASVTDGNGPECPF